jgi:hypothetical protein
MATNPLGFEPFTFTPAQGLRDADYSPSQPESGRHPGSESGISDQLRIT